MKTIRSILFAGLVVLLAPIAYASDSGSVATAPASTTPVAVAPTTAPINYKDAFLAFALDKAKSYSGTVESVVTKAVDKATEEAPIVATEFLKYRLFYHGFWALFCIAMAVVAPTLFIKHWPRFSVDEYNGITRGSALNLIATIIGAVGTFVSIPLMLNWGIPNLLSFVQVLVAPRVYVIEQVLHLMGK